MQIQLNFVRILPELLTEYEWFYSKSGTRILIYMYTHVLIIRRYH